MSSVYAGASFETVVRNTATVSANFDYTAQSFGTVPTIAISVDGGTYTRKNLAETVQLASGLNNGPHTIRVVYDGHDQYENVWGESKTISLKNIVVDSEGTYEPTANRKKNILFVGDSITAGVRSLSTNDKTGGSAVASYPFEVAKNLGANDYRTAFGGAGVTKAGNTGLKVQDFVRNSSSSVLANDSIHTVVMVVGTNDNPGEVSKADFKLAYHTLVGKVRLSYPTQRIYIVDIPTGNGSWATALQEVASENTKCTFIPTTGWSSQITTTDGLHPNQAGAVKLGRLISDALISNGWDSGGTTPEPTPVPQEPTNLWTQPTQFIPLGTGWGFQTGASMPFDGTAGMTFKVTFKAKSTAGQKLKVYTEFKADFDREIVLTPTSTEYTYQFTVTYSATGNMFNFVNQTGHEVEGTVSDIELTNISLIQLT